MRAVKGCQAGKSAQSCQFKHGQIFVFGTFLQYVKLLYAQVVNVISQVGLEVLAQQIGQRLRLNVQVVGNGDKRDVLRVVVVNVGYCLVNCAVCAVEHRVGRYGYCYRNRSQR